MRPNNYAISGITAFTLGEIGMPRAADLEILNWARDHNSVVVTLDADFHAALAVSGATGPSVIRVRLEGLRGSDLTVLLIAVLELYGAEWSRGCLVTVKKHKTTCHRLPVGRRE